MRPFQDESYKQKGHVSTETLSCRRKSEGYRILGWWGTMVKIVAGTSWSSCKDHTHHTTVWNLLGQRTAKHIFVQWKEAPKLSIGTWQINPRNMGKCWTWSILVIHLSWIFRTFWSLKWSVFGLTWVFATSNFIYFQMHELTLLETAVIWRNNLLARNTLQLWCVIDIFEDASPASEIISFSWYWTSDFCIRNATYHSLLRYKHVEHWLNLIAS